jgi:hypothetical protein
VKDKMKIGEWAFTAVELEGGGGGGGLPEEQAAAAILRTTGWLHAECDMKTRSPRHACAQWSELIEKAGTWRPRERLPVMQRALSYNVPQHVYGQVRY